MPRDSRYAYQFLRRPQGTGEEPDTAMRVGEAEVPMTAEEYARSGWAAREAPTAVAAAPPTPAAKPMPAPDVPVDRVSTLRWYRKNMVQRYADLKQRLTGGLAWERADVDGELAKELDDIQKDITIIDKELSGLEAPDKPPPDPGLSTTAQYLPRWDPEARQYVWDVNPNYRPPQVSSDDSTAPGRLTLDQDKFAWEKDKYTEGLTEAERVRQLGHRWDVEGDTRKATADLESDSRTAKANMERSRYEQEETNKRNRLTAQQNLMQALGQQWQGALPYAVSPSAVYTPGFEPGSPYEQLVKAGGGTYNPELNKVNRLQFSPEDYWRLAQRWAGGA